MKKNESKEDETILLKLKAEIEDTLGKKIRRAGDCILLSEEVFNKLSSNVSVITLRRFFGLVKSTFNPSATTLDILSKYCGFSGFIEFKSLKNISYTSIDKNFYASSVLNYLGAVFKNTPTKDRDDKTFMAVVKYAIPFLQRHPELIDKFQRIIAKTKNGQEFYYEQFINVDALNSYYGDGLRYYLTEKYTEEALVFGNSLLCYKYWLTDHPEGFKIHYDKLSELSPSKNMSVIIQARYLLAKLLHTNMQGQPSEKVISKLYQLHDSHKKKTLNQLVCPYVEYIISNTLLITGHPDEALYFINYSMDNYSKNYVCADPGFSNSMNLCRALALAKAGRKMEAEKVFQQIAPSGLHSLKRKTNMALYLFLSRYLNKNTAIMNQQLTDLISETGFTRLYKVFQVS